MASTFTLFENQQSNGTSNVFEEATGGMRWLKISGTFDSATIDLQMDFQDDDYVNMSNYQFTATDSVKLTNLKPGIRLRLNLTSAGASTDITAKLL